MSAKSGHRAYGSTRPRALAVAQERLTGAISAISDPIGAQATNRTVGHLRVTVGIFRAGALFYARSLLQHKTAISLLSIRVHTNRKRWYAVCMRKVVAYCRVSTERQK